MNRPLEIDMDNFLTILVQYSNITLGDKTMISIDDIKHFLNLFSQIIIHNNEDTDE